MCSVVCSICLNSLNCLLSDCLCLSGLDAEIYGFFAFLYYFFSVCLDCNAQVCSFCAVLHCVFPFFLRVFLRMPCQTLMLRRVISMLCYIYEVFCLPSTSQGHNSPLNAVSALHLWCWVLLPVLFIPHGIAKTQMLLLKQVHTQVFVVKLWRMLLYEVIRAAS